VTLTISLPLFHHLICKIFNLLIIRETADHVFFILFNCMIIKMRSIVESNQMFKLIDVVD
jgi:hypothetical protein